MAEYTLKVRRYQPEPAEDGVARGAYWESFDVDLDPTLSVLDGLLQTRDDHDGTLAVRCSCRAAICGSCGVKVNGQSTLACKTQLGEAAAEAARIARNTAASAARDAAIGPVASGARDRRRADGQHAGDQGPRRRHGVDALGEVPARDAVADARGPAAGARVHRARRGDGRRHPGGRLHPVRRLRLGLPVDGGRPRLHRPRGARQGLPLRRRPARRADDRAPLRPRQRPARDLRLHPLLRLHRGLPEGRRADEPDHAAAPPRRRTTTTSRTSTTAATTSSPSRRSSRRRGPSTSRCCCRSPTPPASRAS